jgi:hypothetical protein
MEKPKEFSNPHDWFKSKATILTHVLRPEQVTIAPAAKKFLLQKLAEIHVPREFNEFGVIRNLFLDLRTVVSSTDECLLELDPRLIVSDSLMESNDYILPLKESLPTTYDDFQTCIIVRSAGGIIIDNTHQLHQSGFYLYMWPNASETLWIEGPSHIARKSRIELVNW